MSARFFLAPLLLLAACTVTPPPRPPPAPPDPSGYTCETAGANLADLGGCGLPLDRFVADCHDAQDAEHAVDVRLPVGCLSTAESCDAAWDCR